jgi:O-antigen/teichoic acid export membrane protein
MGAKTLNFLSSNLDRVIIGRFLGAAPLGQYNLAWTVITLPLTQVNPIITKVMLPVFSRIQNDDKALVATYGRVLSYISLATFPMLAGMLIVGRPFIHSVYGEAWLPAVPVLQVYCLLGAVYTLGNPIGCVILAKGRADIDFRLNVLAVIGHIIVVLVGVRWGIFGVAVGLTLFDVAVLFPLSLYILRKLIGLTPADLWRAVRLPTVAVSVMGSVLLLVDATWPLASPHLSLMRNIPLGATVYSLTVWLFGQELVLDAWRLLRLRAN